MYPLLAVVSGKPSQRRVNYDGFLSACMVVFENSAGVSLFPVENNTANLVSFTSPSTITVGIDKKPPVVGLMLAASGNVFANTSPITTNIIGDIPPIGYDTQWVQQTITDGINNKLCVSTSVDNPQTRDSQYLNFTYGDINKIDVTAIMTYYKSNIGTLSQVGTPSTSSTTLGRTLTIDFPQGTSKGNWAIVTLHHQFALVTPSGWELDVTGRIIGSHPNTQIDQKQTSVSVFRKKIDQQDIDEGSVTFNTVG